MHPKVVVKVEGIRGCGWRKLGGIYLVSDGPVEICGRLPALDRVCDCCGRNFIDPTINREWLEAKTLRSLVGSCKLGEECRRLCIVEKILKEDIRSILIWVGTSFYKTPADFIAEAARMGISRRIQKGVPRGFVVGETPVLLAHRHCLWGGKVDGKDSWLPGIFGAFIPQRIEVIVDEETSDEQIESYLRRGMTPVIVKHAGEQLPLDLKV